jgi:hypothetical protein
MYFPLRCCDNACFELDIRLDRKANNRLDRGAKRATCAGSATGLCRARPLCRIAELCALQRFPQPGQLSSNQRAELQTPKHSPRGGPDQPRARTSIV